MIVLKVHVCISSILPHVCYTLVLIYINYILFLFFFICQCIWATKISLFRWVRLISDTVEIKTFSHRYLSFIFFCMITRRHLHFKNESNVPKITRLFALDLITSQDVLCQSQCHFYQANWKKRRKQDRSIFRWYELCRISACCILFRHTIDIDWIPRHKHNSDNRNGRRRLQAKLSKYT